MHKINEGHDCDHSQGLVQRRAAARQEFQLGMPDMGTTITFSSRKPVYYYYCGACQSNLPAADNARWEALYANQVALGLTRPKAVKPWLNPATI